jgi:hypothetical protein
MSSHSQTLIERSPTSQPRSLTSTIGQAARPGENQLAKSCSKISTASIPSNYDDNDESFVLTLCRHKTLGNTYWICQKRVLHCQENLRLESQSSATLQSHYARASSRRDNANPISLRASNVLKNLRLPKTGSCCELDFGRSLFTAVSRRSTPLTDLHASKILC